MKISKLEIILAIIPTISFLALVIFLFIRFIPMETFWNNLTYFLLAGIFIPLATLITLHLTRHQTKHEKQYDAKKLNNDVFRKLMRVRYNTDYKGDLIFEIPVDDRAFQSRKSNIYLMWINDKIMDLEEANDYVSINRDIPNIKIGEKYLQTNYNIVYKMWSDVKRALEKHNERRQNFKKYLGNLAIEKFKTEFPTFKEVAELAPASCNDAYFLDKIQDFLFYILRTNEEHPDFDPLSRLNVWQNNSKAWILQSSSIDVLMASFDERKIDTYKAYQIFKEITSKNEVLESFRKAIEIDSTFYGEVNRFAEHLEDDVVNEIDTLQSNSS